MLDSSATVMHMRRMQLQLEDDQFARLRRRAAASGRSVAALVRDAVDAWLTIDESSVERALAVVGRYHSGLGDLADNHDRYLDEEPKG